MCDNAAIKRCPAQYRKKKMCSHFLVGPTEVTFSKMPPSPTTLPIICFSDFSFILKYFISWETSITSRRLIPRHARKNNEYNTNKTIISRQMSRFFQKPPHVVVLGCYSILCSVLPNYLNQQVKLSFLLQIIVQLKLVS